MMIKLSTNTWWKIIALLSFSVVLINAVKPALGSVEGKFFPVLRNVAITQMEYNEEQRYIDFGGTMEKVRDCDIVGYEWFLTEPDGLGRTRFDVFVFNDRWRFYRMGVQEFGPRRAFVDPDAFLSYAYGIAVYRCHGLYNTRTTFFSGDKVR